MSNLFWFPMAVGMLFTIFMHQASAQDVPQINYTIKDGLPSNIVYAIAQDDRGFIWIGTSAGLSRYDGYEFKNFTLADGLPDVEILKFFEDSAGRIWMYTLNGKVGYIQNDSIYSSRTNPELKGLDMSYRITDIQEKGDKLFLSSANSEIRVYDLTKLQSDSIAYQGGYGELLCGCNDELIWFHEHPVNIAFDPFQAYDIRLVNKDHEEGFFRGGVSYLNCIKESVISFGTVLGFLKQVKTLNLENGSSRIFDMPFTGNDRILNITKKDSLSLHIYSTQGMYQFDPESEQLIKLNDVPNSSSSLKDQNENFWITSISNGLYFQPSQLIIPANDEVQLVSILTIHDEELLLLHDRQYLSRMNKNFETELILKFPRKLTFKDIAIKDNEMIVGAYEGLFFIDLDHGKITHESGPYISITNINNAKEITTYTSTRIFLSRYDSTTKHQSGLELNTRANDMLQLGDSILLATDDGLRYHHDQSISKFLPDSVLQIRINDLVAAHDRIWISTGGHGLVTWSPTSQSLKNYSLVDGLSSDIINKTSPVDDGMWVSTNQGLNRIILEGDSATIEALDSYNILTGKEVKDLIEYNEHIFLAMNDGLFYFPSKYDYDSASDHKIYVDQVISQAGLVTNNSLLPHEIEAVNVTYKLLTFQNKEGIKYQYRLIRNDMKNVDWITTSVNQANYQGLGPGNYHFEVRAKTKNSLWSDPASIHFSINWAYWETTWFKVCLFLLFGLFAYLVFDRITRNKRQKRKLENERIAAEIKALKAQINPHFLFNALNSIQSFLLSNEQDLAEEYLTKYSKLMRRILEQSSLLTIPIHEELETIQLYVDLEKYRSGNRFEFQVSIADDLDEDEKIPSMILQPFVENAIWHGVSHLENGVIRLSLKKESSERIFLGVSDNGRGFDPAKNKKSSMGSGLVRDRLALLNQMEGIQSELSVQTNINEGTTVSIWVAGKLY